MFVVYWLVPRDFRYLRGINDVVFFKHVSTERSRSVVRSTSDNSARLIIFVGLYHFS